MTSKLLRPAYRLTIGGQRVDTTDEPRASTLVELTVSLDLDVPADAATLDLAQLSGLDVYVNSDGAVVMERFVGGHVVHVLEHAKHIVELDVLRSPPSATAAEAWGESPGSGRGTNAWAWVTKDFDDLHGS